MNNKPKNYSNLFALFASDKPDRQGVAMSKLGVYSFTLSFIGAVLGQLIQGTPLEKTLLFKLCLGMWGVGFVVGLLAFLATGIHYIGVDKGKRNFFTAFGYVFWKTFLYILLPTIVITAALIIWALATKQPVFQ